MKTPYESKRDGMKRITVACHNKSEGCRNEVSVEYWDPNDRLPRKLCPTCRESGSPAFRNIDAEGIRKGVERLAASISYSETFMKMGVRG